MIFATTVIVILFGSIAFGKTYYVNSKEGLNLRSDTSTESEVLEKLSFGTALEKIKDSSLKGTDWRKVETEDGVIGYINKEFIQDENPLDEFEYMGEWHTTAYTATGNACANGNMPTAGYTVAHNSLPFGTELYIEGVGFRTVEDRGPGWLGESWCDIFCSSYSECVNYGSKYHNVYVVNYGE